MAFQQAEVQNPNAGLGYTYSLPTAAVIKAAVTSGEQKERNSHYKRRDKQVKKKRSGHLAAVAKHRKGKKVSDGIQVGLCCVLSSRDGKAHSLAKDEYLVGLIVACYQHCNLT